MRSIAPLVVLLAVLWASSAHPLLRLSLNRVADKNIVCPDQKSQCPDKYTCCKQLSGGFGCCPQPNAVCCSDGKHCCAQGYRCDLSMQVCVKPNDRVTKLYSASVSATANRNGGKKNIGNIICPDGGICRDYTTCCRTTTGYGCCPHPNAVCCWDRLHCCREGYLCDLTEGVCVPDIGVTKMDSNMIRVVPSKRFFAKLDSGGPSLKNVVCPDQQSECPDGDTCCPHGGQYGCCPLPNAECCTDGVHCCPSGSTCNLSTNTCVRKHSTSNLIQMQHRKLSVFFKFKNRRL